MKVLSNTDFGPVKASGTRVPQDAPDLVNKRYADAPGGVDLRDFAQRHNLLVMTLASMGFDLPLDDLLVPNI